MTAWCCLRLQSWSMIAGLLKPSVISSGCIRISLWSCICEYNNFTYIRMWQQRISQATHMCLICLTSLSAPEGLLHELRVWYLQGWQLREASTSPLSCCCSWLFLSWAPATSEPTVQTEAMIAVPMVSLKAPCDPDWYRTFRVVQISEWPLCVSYVCKSASLGNFTQCCYRIWSKASPAFVDSSVPLISCKNYRSVVSSRSLARETSTCSAHNNCCEIACRYNCYSTSVWARTTKT